MGSATEHKYCALPSILHKNASRVDHMARSYVKEICVRAVPTHPAHVSVLVRMYKHLALTAAAADKPAAHIACHIFASPTTR